MAIPTLRRAVQMLPDAGGVVFRETWTDDAAAALWWNDAVRYGPPTTIADDGLMGSRFVRLATYGTDTSGTDGTGSSLVVMTAPVWFDQTKPIRAVYKVRVSGYSNNHENGVGVFYVGEPSYTGLWMDYGWGLNALGLYRKDITYTPGSVLYVEMEWDPARCVTRFRTSPTGSWYERAGDFQPHGIPPATRTTSPYLAWPATLLFQSPWPTGTMDVGPVEITGTPMWGSADYLGFHEWLRNGASYYDAFDLEYHLGGLTGTPAGGGEFLNFNDSALSGTPVPGAWDAQSPIIGVQSGARYRELTFQAYNAGAGRLAIRVRNAADGSLLPDSQVPGNSDGLIGTAPTISGTYVMGAGQGSVGTQRVSLAAVPIGTEIYLDVQGVVQAGDATFGAQARLGGVWVSFDRDVRTYAAASLDGTATLVPASLSTTAAAGLAGAASLPAPALTARIAASPLASSASVPAPTSALQQAASVGGGASLSSPALTLQQAANIAAEAGFAGGDFAMQLEAALDGTMAMPEARQAFHLGILRRAALGSQQRRPWRIYDGRAWTDHCPRQFNGSAF